MFLFFSKQGSQMDSAMFFFFQMVDHFSNRCQKTAKFVFAVILTFR